MKLPIPWHGFRVFFSIERFLRKTGTLKPARFYYFFENLLRCFIATKHLGRSQARQNRPSNCSWMRLSNVNITLRACLVTRPLIFNKRSRKVLIVHDCCWLSNAILFISRIKFDAITEIHMRASLVKNELLSVLPKANPPLSSRIIYSIAARLR